jgi:hypothetical protein
MTIIGAQPCQFNEGNTDLVALVNGTFGMPAIGSQRRLLQALMLSPAAQPRRFCPRILRCELAKFAKAVSAQPFRRSLTDLADEKVSFFDAAILIFSPLAGLGPSRSGVALTLNFPNPGSDTSAPLAAASTMSLKMSSTIDLACALLTPCASAILRRVRLCSLQKFLTI